MQVFLARLGYSCDKGLEELKHLCLCDGIPTRTKGKQFTRCVRASTNDSLAGDTPSIGSALLMTRGAHAGFAAGRHVGTFASGCAFHVMPVAPRVLMCRCVICRRLGSELCLQEFLGSKVLGTICAGCVEGNADVRGGARNNLALHVFAPYIAHIQTALASSSFETTPMSLPRTTNRHVSAEQRPM